MSTPLASEPMPGDGQVPVSSVLVDRLYGRLPEAYRTLDVQGSTWPLKRYLYAVADQAGQVDATIEDIAGERPVGPATPEPWGLEADELAIWRGNRLDQVSLLGDPREAPVGWLPWMAQLVGARLDPSASETERRDTIFFATSGYRAGTRQAIADAARSALTGSRYAVVVARQKPSGGVLIDGGPWDITVVTRVSETPDVNAVLGAVERKGAKPAGAVLWHQAYEATWNAVEAAYPLWSGRDPLTWQEIEETGL